MGRSWVAVAAGALFLASQPAFADVATEAAFFDALARGSYAQGRYDVALESFRLVQEIAPSQGTLYNIALCADLAERSDMAFSLYREYLDSDDPDVARREEAAKRIDALKSKLARVAIESEPAGAAVYVDRKELGQFGVTPTTIALPQGEHRLFFEREGAVPSSAAVVARSGQLEVLRVTLAPRFGHVAVHATPASAQIAFVRDGGEARAALEDLRYRLPAGRYRVVASAPGYHAAEAQIAVHADAEVRLDLALAPIPRETGRLLVSTRGVEAEVYVDGKRVAVTPATLSEVGPGQHSVEVRAGTRAARRTVTVQTGRATHLAIDLGGAAR